MLERSAELSPEAGAVRYALGMAHRAAGNEHRARLLLAGPASAESAKPSIDDPILEQVRSIAADKHYFLNLAMHLEPLKSYYGWNWSRSMRRERLRTVS